MARKFFFEAILPTKELINRIRAVSEMTMRAQEDLKNRSKGGSTASSLNQTKRVLLKSGWRPDAPAGENQRAEKLTGFDDA
jgi:hypothetical protein